MFSEKGSKTEAGETVYNFDFLQWPFYWLARADRTYMAILEDALDRISLDIPSWRVLMILHGMRSASVSEISDHAIVKLSTMTKIIQRMSSDGLVAVARSEIDKRVTIVSITEKGEAAGHAAWSEAERIMARAFSEFTDVEKQVLTALLKKLADQLGRY